MQSVRKLHDCNPRVCLYNGKDIFNISIYTYKYWIVLCVISLMRVKKFADDNIRLLLIRDIIVYVCPDNFFIFF